MKTAHSILGEVTEEIIDRVAAKYPERAQERFDALQVAATRDVKGRRARLEETSRLRSEVVQCQNDIDRTKQEIQRAGKSDPATDRRIKTAEKRKARAEKRIAELMEKDKADESSAEDKRREKMLHVICEIPEGEDYVMWIARQRPLATFREKRAELPRGDLKAALKNTTAAINEKLDRYFACEIAPVTPEEAIDETKRQVAEKAAFGRVDPMPCANYRVRGVDGERSLGKIAWPEEPLSAREIISNELGVSFACWLFQDQIVAKLEREIRANMKHYPDAMTIAARRTEQTELKFDIIDLQRVQIRICEELEMPLPMVHPFALFEIEPGEDLPTPAPWPVVRNAPGTPPTLGSNLNSVAGMKAK